MFFFLIKKKKKKKRKKKKKKRGNREGMIDNQRDAVVEQIYIHMFFSNPFKSGLLL
jgi:hypothetical protein